MAKVKMIALDTVLVSSVKQDNLVAGERFECDDDTARRLIASGAAKKAPAAKNKAAAPLSNKSAN